MTVQPIVVVGAGLAGLRAVEQVRAAGWTGRVVVVGSERHPPYNRPPLTKGALRNGPDVAGLLFPQRKAIEDVEWLLGQSAESAQLDQGLLTLHDGSMLSYTGLVIATGVSSRTLPLSSPPEWRCRIRTLEEAERLHKRFVPGHRVLVIGAGFIGCEVACAAVDLGCAVDVVEPLRVPLERPLGSLLGSEIQRRHEAHGVRFHLGRSVVELQRNDDGPILVLLDDGTQIETDTVVEAVGAVPNVEWLKGQGLDLRDGVLCDSLLHPLRDGIPVTNAVALGDVARFPIPLLGGVLLRNEHWAMPTEVAGHAARSLLAGLGRADTKKMPFNPLPSFWTEQYGTRIQAFGAPHLGTSEVRILEGALTDESVVGYYFEGRLTGVVLVGMGARMFDYRQTLIDANTPPLPASTVQERV